MDKVVEQKLNEHDRRILTLENYRENDLKEISENREKDLKIINENNKNLATIINELKHLTSSMDTLANNWKEAISRSNERQKERDDNIDKNITTRENT